MKAPPRRSVSAAAVALLLVVLSHPAGAERVAVSEELERLAAAHGFALRGVEHTQEAFGRADLEDLFPRLRRLLEGFDHVIVQAGDGHIERVIILGEKSLVSAPPVVVSGGGEDEQEAGEDLVLETVRRGNQHAVQISIEGKDGAKIDQTLVVDTGADQVVLPLSVADQLGLDKDAFAEREMQTANGIVTARMGTLPTLWLGETRIEGVGVAFVDDEKLAGNGLLGMSVLGRYRLTIDDEHNQITLGVR